jgi:uncharacterized RDD family membrane protein YckC
MGSAVIVILDAPIFMRDNSSHIGHEVIWPNRVELLADHFHPGRRSQTEEFIMDLESNPYSAPLAPIGTRVESRRLEIAGKGRRFGTYLIDQILCSMCGYVVGEAVEGMIGKEAAERLIVAFFFLGMAVGFSYFVFFEGLMARTPGKFICGTKVVDEKGGPASFGQILGRSACRFIPFEQFSFLGERGWHDSISKTLVVLA